MDDVDNVLEVWATSEPDLESPNAARMYDYHLGGSANFSSAAWPTSRIARANNRG